MHPHERHTSAAHQRNPHGKLKGCRTVFGRYPSPFSTVQIPLVGGGTGCCLENTVKIPGWELFLKRWRGRDEVEGGREKNEEEWRGEGEDGGGRGEGEQLRWVKGRSDRQKVWRREKNWKNTSVAHTYWTLLYDRFILHSSLEDLKGTFLASKDFVLCISDFLDLRLSLDRKYWK